MTKYPMTKEIRNPNDLFRNSCFVILSSLRTWVFRHLLIRLFDFDEEL